ncbi:zf-HC2 domain-containing protein [Streptomyces sp. FXJ1.172]|uniref:anti-sigma factor n=1 Tax=Streptomyces sp. FXJ1.172 TaxID=710705 RepID=UPI0007CFD80B|nr:zf-HC2 domain-containing protein [Streptomyces sp. FXJ1.172]WEO99821.1 zf-HC2 domain-containing protein [Streptomyces sp. FXJ1.172]
MNTDHDAVRMALGGYVLGALPPAEMEQVRAHLATCDACRVEYEQLSGLPALLAMVTAAEAEGQPVPAGAEDLADRLVRRAGRSAQGAPQAPSGMSVAPQAPQAALIDRMLQRAAARRRRTWRLQLAGAATSLMLVAAAAVGGTWLATSTSVTSQGKPPGPTAPTPSRTFSGNDSSTGVTASVKVFPSAWGSVLQVSAHGAPAGMICRLQAIGPGGTRADAATWRAGQYPTGTKIPGAVPMSPGSIDRFEIIAGNGQKLVTIRA